MRKRIIRYIKHVSGTVFLLLLSGIGLILAMNGSFDYNSNPLKINLENEGPYIFYQGDSILNVNYIRGNKTKGFYVDKTVYPLNNQIQANCHFALDSSNFEFNVSPSFNIPGSTYFDDQPIIAVSDIESSFKTLRDFLISHEVINSKLNWIFGKGHLVLLGDFIDRGFSTTQVLWFIYKLEQDAKKQGGMVHFILGNHELYNIQGKFKSAAYKYYGVASILGKQHHQLYDQGSFLGRWLASKNTMELINGHLFVHGGIHPDIADYDITIDEINHINRVNYRYSYYPKPIETIDQIIRSNKKGICWYRGYFNDNLSQEDVEKGIEKFNAKDIVVGHTLQWSVKKLYQGKVYAIDVKHPKDYNKNWPGKASEGLLITKNKYFRLKAEGNKIEL